MTKGEFIEKFKNLPDDTRLLFCRDDGWGYDTFACIQARDVGPSSTYAQFEMSCEGEPAIIFYT